MRPIGIEIALAFMLTLAAAAAPAQMQIQTLEPKHTGPEELVPVLRPLLTPPESISAFRGRLVIRAKPETLRELERLLPELDRAPAALLITVRRGGESGDTASTLEAGGGLIYRHTRAREREHSTQRVRVLEGRPAFIDAGTEQPTVERIVSSGPGGAVISDAIAFERASTGFYVRARIRGHRVTVDIAAHRRRPNSSAGFELFDAYTTVSGTLGQWLPVGTSSDEETRSALRGQGKLGTDARPEARSGIRLETRSRRGQRTDRIWLRVDRVD